MVCPRCRTKMHGIKVGPETQAVGIRIRCDRCKADYNVNIESGQCSIRSRCP